MTTRKLFANFIVFFFILFICCSTLINLHHCSPLGNEVQEGHHLHQQPHIHPHLSSSSLLLSKSLESYPTSSDASLPFQSLKEDFPEQQQLSSHDSSSSSDSSISSSKCSLEELTSLFKEDHVVRKALEVYSEKRGLEQMKLIIQEATGLHFSSHINSIPIVAHDHPAPSISEELSSTSTEDVVREFPKKFSPEKVVKSNQVTEDDGVQEFIGSVNGHSSGRNQETDSNRDEQEIHFQEQVGQTGNGPLDRPFDGEFKGTIDIPVNLDSSVESSSQRRKNFNNNVVVSMTSLSKVGV